MKLKALLIGLGLVASVAHAHNLVPGAPQSGPILLQGGTIHTVTQGRLDGADLLFVDGKIVAVGENLQIPDGTTVIDIQGQHVYPGIIALDTTLGIIEIPAIRATVDTNEVGNFTPEVMAHHAFNADSEIIPTIRYNGVTHAQVVPQGPLVRGQSSLMKLDSWNWRDGIEASPNGMHVSWPRTGLNNSPWERRTPEQQRKAQQEQREQLQQLFSTAKVYHEARESGAQTRVDQRWEAMRSLFKGEQKLFVHADDRRQIEQVLAFNEAYGFELVIMGGRDAWMLADELAAADVAVVFGAAYGLPSRVDEAYDSAFSTPKLLADAGVNFAIAYPGFWDVRNLAFAAGNAVAYGLDYDQAIAAITYGPAQILGVADRLGSIEVGKQATFIVSSGDVLDHLGQDIQHMFIDGRAIDLSNRHWQLYQKYQERITE